MLKSVLIANRGEIACRIITTARRMGIQTIAVYSDPDRQAQHVKQADRALHIGNASSADSYLNIPKIIALANAAKVDAIHPGYGFLSENPEFARQCEQHGIVFIGPQADIMAKMGDKAEAKKIATTAGIPVLEGYNGERQDLPTLLEKAGQTGFPLLIKALAGGGGRGLRRVDRMEDFEAALASAKRESMLAFSDDRVLLERFVQQPRHIEVQVLADQHGNCITLSDRDCTVQRKHQKVIEEAPAVAVDAATRKQLALSAQSLTQQVGYRGAGTIEFLVSGTQYWFMEMNTRLQVEHPVTEMVSGLDLVEWQFRIAAGETLSMAQGTTAINGHSIEIRLYAEDPGNEFMPDHGRLELVQFPPHSDQLRIDSGIAAGDYISTWYDPMIAKLISYGENRQQALTVLTQALEQTRIAGLTTNRLFLLDCLRHEDFVNNRISTDFLQQAEFDKQAEAERLAILSAALALHIHEQHLNKSRTAPGKSTSPWLSSVGWRLQGHQPACYHLFRPDQHIIVQVEPVADGLQFSISEQGAEDRNTDNQRTVCQNFEYSHSGNIRGHFDGEQHSIDFLLDANSIEVIGDCFQHKFALRPDRSAAFAGDPQNQEIRSSLPGKILECAFAQGQAVTQGDTVFLIESMKMEHSIIASSAGVIEELLCRSGEMIEAGQILARLKQPV